MNQEGHSEELAIFQTPIVDTGIERIEWVGFRPVSQLTIGSPVEFNIPGHSTSYIDLKKTRIHIKLRLVKGDGKPVSAENSVGLVNLSLQSMWSQVDVSLQNQVVSPSIANNYGYKSMIDVLLHNEEDPKLTQLQTQLFFQDTHNAMDDPNPGEGQNNGLLKRYELTKDGKSVDLEGPLYTDICSQGRLILNGVPINIKLWQQKSAFTLMSSEDNADYNIEITDAVLKVCMVKVSPGVMIGHGEALQKSPASYPFVRTDIRSFAIPAGQYTAAIENIFQGAIPSSVIVAMVASEAYSGSLKRNPFNFAHYETNFLGFYVNGQSRPTHPLQPNFADNNFIEAYTTLFTGTGKYGQNSGNYIQREEYDGGYSLFVFDIDARGGDLSHAYLQRGSTRLELRFNSALPEAITVIVYGTFPATLQIDQARNVRL